MKDYLVYILVRLIVAMLQMLSLEKAAALADGLAWLCSDVFKVRGRLVEDNLLHAFPEKTPAERHEIVRGMWRHLLRMLVEAAFAERKIHLNNWKDFVTLENEVPALRAMYEGRPVLLATGHLGNFEFAGYILGLIGIPAYSVARTLDNPYLDHYLNSFRRSSGQQLIPKSQAAPMLNQAMELGRTVAILTDQDAGPGGVKSKCFGRTVSSHKVVSILAQMFNAPVGISSAIRHNEELFHFTIGVVEYLEVSEQPELANPKAMAKWYNDGMERVIRQTPSQYWWLHKRWRYD